MSEDNYKIKNKEKYIKILKKYFGFDKFRDKQLDIIRAVLEDRRDVCATMFTGAGKSLCYQFPPVYTNKTCIVVSPLISLMNDQKIKLDKLGIPSICLNSTLWDKDSVKGKILDNKYRIVYTSPEYLITQEDFIRDLHKKDIIIACYVDEAHCTSMWGHDFRESYKELKQLKDRDLSGKTRFF